MLRDDPRRLGADGLPARDSVRDLLLHTLPGRALVVGAAVRLLASLAQLIIGRTPLSSAWFKELSTSALVSSSNPA